MINFVTRDEKKAQSLLKIRRTVTGVTSLVLGVYFIGVAGLFGWNLLWNTKEQKVGGEEVALRQQITSLSENEVLVMKLADRAAEVNNVFSSRDSAYVRVVALPREEYTIKGWEYVLGGVEKVTVTATGPLQLKMYEDYLKTQYKQVQVDRVNYDTDTGWTETMLVKGRIKT